MRQSITQEFSYGCGIACYAFALNLSYKQAVEQLGQTQANSDRFWVKDFREALNQAGLTYTSKHSKSLDRNHTFEEGTIILIRRSRRYPTGHYLIRYQGAWMDPWINLPYSSDISKASSGFRQRLPGKVMFALLPVHS
jgi:hypothetical protein